MIGIFGGTFDPVHNGHLQIAQDVQRALGLSEVRLIPLHQAVHRAQPQAGGKQRLAMLRSACADTTGIVVDDREIRRGGPSYMVDTLQDLHNQRADETLCLLLGGDAFDGFATWHQPQRILALAHIVVLQRPGTPRPHVDSMPSCLFDRIVQDAADLTGRPCGRILFLTVSLLDISSTDIRRRIRDHAPYRQLIPPPVADYIEAHGLYL